MEYGKIITRAWNIVWENKWLFVLGFLAALGSGGSSSSGSNFNTSFSDGSDFSPPSNFEDYVPIIIAGACVLFFLALAFWLLRLIGEAGMIASVDRIEAGEKLTLRDGFRAGTAHLKSMVSLSLVLYGPFLLVGLLILAGLSLPFIGLVSGGNDEGLLASLGLLGLCLIPVGCIMALAGLVVNFVYPMAQRSIIIHKMGTVDGIRDGWQILRTNLGEIFILALIFFFIGIAVGFASLIVAVPLALIFIVPIIVTIINGGAVLTAATVIFGLLGIIAFALVTAAIGAIVRTLQSTSFTLAYHQWAGKKAISAT